MPRARNVALAFGAALLVKRAMGRRIEKSPLWPLPALDRPTSGTRGQRRTDTGASTGMRLTVTERDTVADGVVRLRLSGAEGAPLPAWEPGAHLDLVLPSGLVRQYSLCGDPAEADAYTVATRLIGDGQGGRGGSREVHERLCVGTEVEVRGPRNRFPLVEAPAYLFVAGGIGITPVLPMLRAAEAAGARWHLVYGGRTRASMPFLEDIAKLGGPRGTVTLVPEDEAGLPDLAAALAWAPPEAAVYCCGPEPLMAALGALCAQDPPGGGFHLERFAPAAGPGPGGSGGSGEDSAFEVELRRSGTTLTVPADTTALAAIREVRPDTAYSCAQGFCGTCQTRVLEGAVDHRDELLTDSERDGSMLICVSRARDGRLTLDM
ncbi:PDR/VanB family oxidoreductase [Streptomyces daliensis]|uniref:Oxidoreductase n=1 Tax=Streptomyces daliensis TaxID=299421 RepID=A0A8T4IPW9_9ACTN|nr:oxidoreductase [Streptomyces daliensis]